MRERAAIGLVLLVGCGPGAAPAPPVANAGHRVGCRPYLESAGQPLQLSPTATVTFTAGVPLVVTAIVDDTYEVAPAGLEAYRAVDEYGSGSHAFVARTLELDSGVTALAGARVEVSTVEGDTVEIRPASLAYRGHHQLGCDDLAGAATAAGSWLPSTPTSLEDETELAGGDGEPLACLHAGASIDLVGLRGDRAQVRAAVDGFVLSGTVSAAAIRQVGGLIGGCSGEMQGGFGRCTTCDGTPCTGTARLAAGAPIATAWRGDPAARPLPSLDRDVQVELRLRRELDRLVEIRSPEPDVAAVVAWVRAENLSDAGCLP